MNCVNGFFHRILSLAGDVVTTSHQYAEWSPTHPTPLFAKKPLQNQAREVNLLLDNRLEIIPWENESLLLIPNEWGHSWNYILSYLFSFTPAQFTVYSAVVCLTALQPFIKPPLSIIWCSQLKLRKVFGVVSLILPPLTLCSPKQRYSSYCFSYAMTHWSLDDSVNLFTQLGFIMLAFSKNAPQKSSKMAQREKL